MSDTQDQDYLRSAPLREFQVKALSRLEHCWTSKLNNHIVVQSPTGSGKSRIFIEFLKKFKSKGILISPLISLARQQHRQLLESGIPSKLQMGSVGDPPPQGAGVWIVSPEFLLSQKAHRQLNDYQPNFIIVDECHCLWEWGLDFRPAYQKIYTVIELQQIKFGLWLTATLPKEAGSEIETKLQRQQLNVEVLGSFDFPEKLELRFLRVDYSRKQEVLLRLIRHCVTLGPGVMFVCTRARTEQWQNLLQKMGLKADIYHAGLSKEERENQESRVRNQGTCPQVLVSTNAFGLGMDVSHLRWVLIEGIVGNVLTMCQMMGRVGRSQVGIAYLVWSEEDFIFFTNVGSKNNRRIQELGIMKEFLMASHCRLEALRSHFFNSATENRICRRCDSCLS